MSSPSPCNYNAKLIKHETQPLTKQGSFTSVQMVHTHASLPRGFCLRFASGKGYYPFPEAEMASKYREESSIELNNPKAHKASSGNASMRRACSDNVRVDSAK